MADTVNGGAYQQRIGNDLRWVNANGEPLDKSAQAEAEKLSAEREQRLAEQERVLVEQTAMRDPVARALLQQQAQQAATRSTAKSEK
jgi:hypothetical protein